MPENDLLVAAGGNDGVPTGTPVPGGVETTAPATAAPTVPATPTQPANDAVDWRARYEADMAKAQADLNATKSSLQSQISQVQRAKDQESRALMDELHRMRMASMDEPERKQYELEMARSELSELRGQLEQERHRADELSSVGSIVQSFARMGIPASMLDLEHGTEALAESGWRAVVQKMNYLEQAVRGVQTGARPAASPTQPAPAAPATTNQQPGTYTPPQVAPPGGGTVTTGRTWGSVLAALKSETGQEWTEEDVYRAVEQGRLQPSILPGLENIPPRG